MQEPDTGQAVLSEPESGTQDSQPRTAFRKRKFLHDYLSMAGFNVLSIGISFLNTSALLALLGRSAYGDIVSCTSMALLISLFATEWSASATVRFGTEEYLDHGHASATFWNRLAIVACCVGIALPLVLTVLRFFGTSLGFTRQMLMFLSVYLPVSIYWFHVQRFLPAIRWHNSLYPLLCLERLSILCVIGASYATDRLTTGGVLAGYVLGSLAAGAVSTYLIRHQIGRPRRPDREQLAKILNFSWPLVPTVWIGALSTNALDYLFVRRYVGAAELAVYSLGVQISGMAQQLPQVAGTLAAPRIVGLRLKDDGTRLERFVRHDFVLAQWAWVSACFLGALGFAWVGPAYVPANYGLLTRLVWPLAIVTSLLPMWYVVWSPLLTAFEKTRTIMWAGSVSGLMNLAANSVLVPRYRELGSAWATVLAFSVTMVVAELLTRRSDSVEIPRRGLMFYLPTVVMALAGLAGFELFG